MIVVESSVVFFPPLNGPFLGEERIAHPSIFLTTLEVTEPWLSSKMSNFLGKKTRQTWNLTEGIQVFEDQITNPKKLTAGSRGCRGLDQWFVPLFQRGVYIFQAGTRRLFSGGCNPKLETLAKVSLG